jgi:quercetin dioxygenase-like cupin family protein
MPEQATLAELPATSHARPFEAGEPAVVRLALDAGERVDPHTHPDRQVVLLLQTGVLDLDLDDETHRLEAGDVIRFDGRREVSPRAVEDSEALVVLARRVEE